MHFWQTRDVTGIESAAGDVPRRPQTKEQLKLF